MILWKSFEKSLNISCSSRPNQWLELGGLLLKQYSKAHRSFSTEASLQAKQTNTHLPADYWEMLEALRNLSVT